MKKNVVSFAKARESKLMQFAKGLITPESLTVSGSLTPKQSKKFISAIIKNNAFLGKVTTQTMNSLQQYVDAYDIAEGILVRVAEGSEPLTAQKKGYSNIGCTLEALKVQLFADVTRSTLENNADNPNFESMLFNGFATRWGNELVKLGFEGTADSGATFATLNKGWITIAAASDAVNSDTYTADGEGDCQLARLEALVAKIPVDIKGPGVSILMNWADYEALQKEVAEGTNSTATLLKGNADTFMGYPLERVKWMPKGKYMATPLKNLVFGISTSAYRGREWNGRKRCMEYTFDLGCDYEIIVKKWVALLTAAA